MLDCQGSAPRETLICGHGSVQKLTAECFIPLRDDSLIKELFGLLSLEKNLGTHSHEDSKRFNASLGICRGCPHPRHILCRQDGDGRVKPLEESPHAVIKNLRRHELRQLPVDRAASNTPNANTDSWGSRRSLMGRRVGHAVVPHAGVDTPLAGPILAAPSPQAAASLARPRDLEALV